MTDRKEQLKDIVNGLVLDIFQAEEALALDKEIGINADSIKEAKFEELFGSLQNIFVAHLILAVTKLFEPRNQRYPTRSIPAALDILRNYSNELEIEDKQSLAEKLIEFKYGKEAFQSLAQLKSGLEITQYREKLQSLSDPDIIQLVVKHFSEELPTIKKTDELEIEDKQSIVEKLMEFKYGKEALQSSAQSKLSLEITQYIENLQSLSNPDITKSVVEYFSKQLPDVKRTESLSLTLNALKTQRDKTIAHHEVIEIFDIHAATYAELDELLNYAKQFVATVGSVYFGNTFYEDLNGNYHLSSDASLASRQLKRLFVECGILKSLES